jgi:hypothetical protein
VPIDHTEKPREAPGFDINEEHQTPGGRWEDGGSNYGDRDYTGAKHPGVSKTPMPREYEGALEDLLGDDK